MEYDRGALARLLGLHTEQLPLFAALRADGALSPFHRRLLGRTCFVCRVNSARHFLKTIQEINSTELGPYFLRWENS